MMHDGWRCAIICDDDGGNADDGRGVAIGFSREFLRAVHKKYHLSGLRFESVIYEQQRQERIVKHF